MSEQPNPGRREYVVGLPVLVTVDDGGFVSVTVDLAELSVIVQKDSTSGPLGTWDGNRDTHTIAAEDSEILERWKKTHEVSNEGFADMTGYSDVDA